MPTHRGGCHCGRIRFEADGEIESVLLCNCSICQRTGYLHWPVGPERFRLLAGDGEYATYQFGTRVAKHHFCRNCGISPFRVARSHPEDVDINVRCLEGVDIDALPVSHFDGRNWEGADAKRRAADEGGPKAR
jgi:hypothetical protein